MHEVTPFSYDVLARIAHDAVEICEKRGSSAQMQLSDITIAVKKQKGTLSSFFAQNGLIEQLFDVATRPASDYVKIFKEQPSPDTIRNLGRLGDTVIHSDVFSTFDLSQRIRLRVSIDKLCGRTTSSNRIAIEETLSSLFHLAATMKSLFIQTVLDGFRKKLSTAESPLEVRREALLAYCRGLQQTHEVTKFTQRIQTMKEANLEQFTNELRRIGAHQARFSFFEKVVFDFFLAIAQKYEQFSISEAKDIVQKAKEEISPADVHPIAKDFTQKATIEEQRAAHESAKVFLKENLAKLSTEISFISPPVLATPAMKTVTFGQLKPTVFGFQYTTGVLQDIQKDGHRSKNPPTTVVYSAASQFNGCEAPGKYTVLPNQAVKTYEGDYTQGPQAQLAYADQQVELINCGGNIGFNGLCNVLDEKTKATIAHGYFTPDDSMVGAVIGQLKTKGHAIEYPCIVGTPKGGSERVELLLVAAPAYGGYSQGNTPNLEVQFLCALHAYRAQFEHCVQLAKATGQSVVFKPTAVGLSAFGNDVETVAKAFSQAAMEYQDALENNHVRVLFQVFKAEKKEPNPEANKMVQLLNLSQESR